MLSLLQFQNLTEQQHKVLQIAMDADSSFKDWRKFFGQNYLVRVDHDDLSKLNAFIKKTLGEEQACPSFLASPFYATYSGWADPALWKFVHANKDALARKPTDKLTPKKERSQYIIDPDTLEMTEDVDLTDLILNADTKEAVHDMLAIFDMYDDAARRGVHLDEFEFFQNTLITGLQGVGKTTLAKAFARAIRDARGGQQKTKIYFVKPAQLVGTFKNQSIESMQTLLDEAGAGIVIIDEVDTYLDNGEERMLDAINTHMGDKPNEPLVICTLYNKNVERFKAANAGFSRRFPNIVQVEAQADEALVEILRDQMENANLEYEEEAIPLIAELLHDMRYKQGKNFGSVGEAENILGMIVKNMALRRRADKEGFVYKALAQDVPEYDPQSGKLRKRKPQERVMIDSIADALSAAPVMEEPDSGNVVHLDFGKG